MPTDKQVEALRGFQTAIEQSEERRRQWSNIVGDVLKVVETRCAELSEATGIKLAAFVFGPDEDRAIQLELPRRNHGRAGNRFIIEHGASLVIGCVTSGRVVFGYHPAHFDDDQKPQEKLGNVDPSDVLGQVDGYLEKFLEKARIEHWSHVKR